MVRWCTRFLGFPTHLKEASGPAGTPVTVYTGTLSVAESFLTFTEPMSHHDTPALSLSQIRKLEFLLADAVQQDCDSVITSGGIQSNHARTTAVAARQLGLQPHLVLRWRGEIVSPAMQFTLTL